VANQQTIVFNCFVFLVFARVSLSAKQDYPKPGIRKGYLADQRSRGLSEGYFGDR
jgi:hypothetical protein